MTVPSVATPSLPAKAFPPAGDRLRTGPSEPLRAIRRLCARWFVPSEPSQSTVAVLSGASTTAGVLKKAGPSVNVVPPGVPLGATRRATATNDIPVNWTQATIAWPLGETATCANCPLEAISRAGPMRPSAAIRRSRTFPAGVVQTTKEIPFGVTATSGALFETSRSRWRPGTPDSGSRRARTACPGPVSSVQATVAVPFGATPTTGSNESVVPVDRLRTGVQPAAALPTRPRKATVITATTPKVRADPTRRAYKGQPLTPNRPPVI